MSLLEPEFRFHPNASQSHPYKYGWVVDSSDVFRGGETSTSKDIARKG